jgi:ABC-type glutathione transport system ATPase component
LYAIEVSHLEKHFYRRRGRRRVPVLALDDMSFTISRRECIAVLGQNGSGKSTLVRALSTLLLPDGGSAKVFGHDVVREAGAVRRLVNRVSVEASFFKRMSATPTQTGRGSGRQIRLAQPREDAKAHSADGADPMPPRKTSSENGVDYLVDRQEVEAG